MVEVKKGNLLFYVNLNPWLKLTYSFAKNEIFFLFTFSRNGVQNPSLLSALVYVKKDKEEYIGSVLPTFTPHNK